MYINIFVHCISEFRKAFYIDFGMTIARVFRLHEDTMAGDKTATDNKEKMLSFYRPSHGPHWVELGDHSEYLNTWSAGSGLHIGLYIPISALQLSLNACFYVLNDELASQLIAQLVVKYLTTHPCRTLDPSMPNTRQIRHVCDRDEML